MPDASATSLQQFQRKNFQITFRTDMQVTVTDIPAGCVVDAGAEPVSLVCCKTRRALLLLGQHGQEGCSGKNDAVVR